MNTQIHIVNLLRPIPIIEYSHEYGYALSWKQRIEYLKHEQIEKEVCHVNLINRHTTYLLKPLENHQRIVVCIHGAHFTGNINLIGGLTPGLRHYVMSIFKSLKLDHHNTLYFHQWEGPQEELLDTYYRSFLKRIEQSERTDDVHIQKSMDTVLRACKPMFLKNLLPTHKLIVGDSHCFAFADVDYNINYKNGVTLASNIKQRPY